MLASEKIWRKKIEEEKKEIKYLGWLDVEETRRKQEGKARGEEEGQEKKQEKEEKEKREKNGQEKTKRQRQD